MSRALVALLTIALSAIGVSLTAAPATAGQPVITRLYRAIDQLPVATETRTGYERDLFRHWVDADGDCQDSRDEVLLAESLVQVSGCDIQTGRWRSYYDGIVTRSSSAFDIDHLVPLAEAWDSGAKRWNAATRERYANDLGDPRTLVAVTASSNRSKSDQDPAEWMPPLGKCTYVRQWVAVKIRWNLKVDAAEKRALRSQAAGCKNATMRVTRALVGTGASSGGTAGGTGGQDPRFATCTDAKAAGYGPYFRGSDPEYDWYIDGDSDGIACE